ncbi:hypothetical protein Zmor_003963 [Zophobas morio]|uniref:Uncharacterized protein n=1 Tax=Zophobas morio TaxID=2755281 RepID=A0AA38HJJ3_9CUCU|nr:hypothetical protein Zmor_003963 [Zophobas morio]
MAIVSMGRSSISPFLTNDAKDTSQCCPVVPRAARLLSRGTSLKVQFMVRVETQCVDERPDSMRLDPLAQVPPRSGVPTKPQHKRSIRYRPPHR